MSTVKIKHDDDTIQVITAMQSSPANENHVNIKLEEDPDHDIMAAYRHYLNEFLSADAKVMELSSANDSLSRRLDRNNKTFEKLLDDERSKRKKIEKDKQDLEAKLERMQMANTKLGDEKRVAEDKLKKGEVELNNIQHECTVFLTRENECATVDTSEFDAIVEERNELERLWRESRLRGNDLHTQMVELKCMLDNAKKLEEDTDARVTKLIDENIRLAHELEEARNKNAVYDEETLHFAQKLKAHEVHINEQKEMLQNLRRGENEMQKARLNLDNVSKMKFELENRELERKLEAMKESKDKAETYIDTLRSELDDARESNKKLLGIIDELRCQMEEMKISKDELVVRFECLESERDDMEERKKSTEEVLQPHKDKMEKMNERHEKERKSSCEMFNNPAVAADTFDISTMQPVTSNESRQSIAASKSVVISAKRKASKDRKIRSGRTLRSDNKKTRSSNAAKTH